MLRRVSAIAQFQDQFQQVKCVTMSGQLLHQFQSSMSTFMQSTRYSVKQHITTGINPE